MLLRPGCRRWRHCRRPVECVSSLPSRRSVEWHFGKDVPQGLKRLRKKSAPEESKTPPISTARLKSCPDKSVSFSAACKALIRRTVLGATKVVP